MHHPALRGKRSVMCGQWLLSRLGNQRLKGNIGKFQNYLKVEKISINLKFKRGQIYFQ